MSAGARPAFYALAPGGWRDYVTLLHPPYTLWHLSYVAIGAALAPEVRVGWLLETLAGLEPRRGTIPIYSTLRGVAIDHNDAATPADDTTSTFYTIAWQFFAQFSTDYMEFTPKIASTFTLYVRLLLASTTAAVLFAGVTNVGEVLLARDVRGTGLWRTLYYLPAVLPGVAVVLLWQWLLGTDGLFNVAFSPIVLASLPSRKVSTSARLVKPSAT